jgi:hypothetical protein
VAEEHGVGDRPEEGGPHQQPRDRQGIRVAGRHARGHQPDEPDDRSHEVERRWELGRVDVDGLALPVDARHRGHPGAARLDPLTLARHARRLAADRHDEGDRRREDDPEPRCVPQRDARAVAAPEEQRAQCQQAVGPAQQPSVAEGHLATSGGDPQEEETADGPLQEDRGGVEADHSVGSVRPAARRQEAR